MHQIQFRLGLRPKPRWGSLQRSPNPLAGFNTYRPITHIKALITVTVATLYKKTLVMLVFADLRPEWLSFLDDFVTTNFGTRAPRARAPPGAKFWRRH